MNIFKSSWMQLNKELVTFLYLIVIQTLLNFSFPALFGLEGGLFDYTFRMVASVICALIYAIIIMFPENISAQMTLSFFDNFPNALFVKRLFIAFMLMVHYIAHVYLWYIDYYHVSFMWYVMLYVHQIITFILLYYVVQRFNEISKAEKYVT